MDDKSFNQSSWEGLQAWGKEHDLPEGSKGYAYIQSNDALTIQQILTKRYQVNSTQSLVLATC